MKFNVFFYAIAVAFLSLTACTDDSGQEELQELDELENVQSIEKEEFEEDDV